MPPTFTLGNQMLYNGYENRALEPGQDYVFFILAELNSTSAVSWTLNILTITYPKTQLE